MKLIASQFNNLLDLIKSLLVQLNLPPKDEYLTAATTAIHDIRAASTSSWNLTYLTFRPVFILLGILSHYLAIILRVIAKHSLAHGWIALKEGYSQLRFATIWFVKFQRDLPSTAKYAELGGVIAIAVLWLLRRHVKKYRYVERIVAWYNTKKRRLLNKYHNFVQRVAKTSSFLAALLPHVLYAILVFGLKRMVPSLITYLATRTYLCTVINFWHPLYLTFMVVGRLAPYLKEYRQELLAQDSNESERSSTKKSSTVTSKLKQQLKQKEEMEVLRVEVIDLLKYWVVYAILLALVRTGKLLPFVGHVLNVTTDNPISKAAQQSTTTGYFSKKAAATGLYSMLRLTNKFVEEVTLMFFVWLRMMPSSITIGDVEKEAKNTTTIKSRYVDKRRPVDILYKKLSPFVLSAMHASAFLKKRAFGDSSRNNERGSSTVVSMVIQKFESVLDLCVLVRLISKNSRDWIVTTAIESSALLPAVTTLLMPSYFTNYGVIYVSFVVPAGYSITSCNAIRISTSRNIDDYMPEMDDGARYLQFWIVHAAVTLLLASLAPMLAWTPLSTHATWLLWAYVQLESTTRRIFGWFESELGKQSLEETAVMRSTKRFIAALPSNVDDSVSKPNDASPAATGAKTKVA